MDLKFTFSYHMHEWMRSYRAFVTKKAPDLPIEVPSFQKITVLYVLYNDELTWRTDQPLVKRCDWNRPGDGIQMRPWSNTKRLADASIADG